MAVSNPIGRISIEFLTNAQKKFLVLVGVCLGKILGETKKKKREKSGKKNSLRLSRKFCSRSIRPLRFQENEFTVTTRWRPGAREEK